MREDISKGGINTLARALYHLMGMVGESDSLRLVLTKAFDYVAGLERVRMYVWDKGDRDFYGYVSYTRGEIEPVLLNGNGALNEDQKNLLRDKKGRYVRKDKSYEFTMVVDDYNLIESEHRNDAERVEMPMVFNGDVTGAIIYEGDNLNFSGSNDHTDLLLFLASLTRAASILVYNQMDPLTQMHTKGKFEIDLTLAVRKAIQSPKDVFTLLMIDLDHFKNVNDVYGHDAGDLVLREMAKRIRGSIRETEAKAYRVGGEEFAIILRNLEDIAYHVARRILKNVSSSPVRVIDLEGSPRVLDMTCSIGIAEFEPLENITLKDSISNIKRDADSALYEAKRLGRNCAVVRKRKSNGSVVFSKLAR